MEKYKKFINNNKFKTSTPTWNNKFELPDGSYSISDIQDYFEHILKLVSEKIDNPSKRMNKIENRIKFKITTGYYFELLTPGSMKLLQSTKNEISKDRNFENVAHLEVALVH